MVTWNTKIDKPICFILFGHSLSELDSRIQEFKDLDVCWVSLNWQFIAQQILNKIDKKLQYHVWFKGAQGTEHESAIRLEKSDARGCSLLEFIHQCCENGVKELYLFGADGFSDIPNKPYYGIDRPENHGHERHVGDLEHFNNNYPIEQIKKSGLSVFNTSQISKYIIPKITLDECLEKIKHSLESISSEEKKTQ